MSEESTPTIEQVILKAVHEGIGDAVRSRITQYANPLNAQIDSVIAGQGDVIKALVNGAFAEALSGELRAGLQTALAHKLARVLVSKMEGEIEKRVNDLRSNPSTRAAITLAIESAIQKL